MNRSTVNTFALACGLALGAATSVAFSMTATEYKSGKDKIAADYKTTKAKCESLSGNAQDICETEAKGKEKVAKAELEAGYKPSPKADYELRLAHVEADYAVAKERCDDQAGNAKDVCVKEAKAAEVSGKAEAKTHMQGK